MSEFIDASINGKVEKTHEIIERLFDLTLPALGKDETVKLKKFREEKRSKAKEMISRSEKLAEKLFRKGAKTSTKRTGVRSAKIFYVNSLWRELSRIIIENELVTD